MYDHHFDDLTGRQFGHWSVLKRAADYVDRKGQSKQTQYLCRCVCGTEKVVGRNSLVRGSSKSCGCRQYEDLLGKTVGNFEVLELSHVVTKGSMPGAHWKVKCLRCGDVVVRRGSDLKKIQSCGCLRRKAPGVSGFNRLLRMYKANARNKKREFSLTKEEFRTLTKQDCHYCGAPPAGVCGDTRRNNLSHSSYVYNGIDRKDSSKGYTKENCLPCCGTCNRMKMELSYDDFLNVVRKINKNLDLGA